MTFPTPHPSTLTDDIKCVLVFVPVDDNSVFLSDLLGQYTELVAPYSWDGTYEERGNISQLWHKAYGKTLEWLESGICGEIIDEDGNMALNVNVNTDCGCGGSGGSGDCVQHTVINNYNTGGSVCFPVETSPMPPPSVPPLVPDGSGGFEIPPAVYPNDPVFGGTTSDYNLQRCNTANYAYQWVHDWVSEMKKVDNLLLSSSAVVLYLTSSGVLAVIGMISRIAPAELLNLASAIVGLSAIIPLWDEWIDDLLGVIESRKEDFICAIYGSGDTGGATQQWVDETINEAIDVWELRPDWSQNFYSLAFQYLKLLLPATPIASWARLNDVAINFVADFDCSTCGEIDKPVLPVGWEWRKAVVTGDLWQGTPVNQSTVIDDNKVTLTATSGNGSSGWNNLLSLQTTPSTGTFYGTLLSYNLSSTPTPDAGGFGRIDYMLRGGGSQIFYSNLAVPDVGIEFYSVNVNVGSPEETVVTDIINELGGHGQIGNASTLDNLLPHWAYNAPWVETTTTYQLEIWQLWKL